jgi:hypothetical protein
MMSLWTFIIGLFYIFICQHVVCAAVTDSPYYQDVSHRALYKNQPPVANFEPLPFTLSPSTRSMVYVKVADCFITLSENVVYSSSRNGQQVKLNLDSPYNPWKVAGSLDATVSSVLIPSSDSVAAFYAVTSDNILAVTMSANNCDAVVSTVPLLKRNTTWGTITATTSSASHIWLTSSTSPDAVTQVNLKAGTTETVKIAGMTFDDKISSLYWVEAWNKLFVGSNVALFTLSQKQGKFVKTQHEWIGGLIDSVVLDMSYDAVYDALWVAEVNSVHKLTANGIWYRYGQRQGSTNAQITSVVAVNGFVYVGSAVGLSRVRGDADPAQHYKGVESLHDDPWSWSFYAGQRYLADDSIAFVVAGAIGGSSSVAIAVTAAGLALFESDLWTLEEKSQVMESYQYRHVREGLTATCELGVYADVTSYANSCTDNDGLWTAMHAMAETYRFLSTGVEAARSAAWEAFEGMEKLSIYPGNYPYFPARTIVSVNSSGLSGCSGSGWFQSPVDPAYMWKSTTSSDSIDGHLALYPLIYDHIARTDEEKKRAYDLIEGITGGILANDLYLIDPSTGLPTKWGFWGPTEVINNPDHYSERGSNSIEILAYLASAYSVTHDNKYKSKFWELAREYDYIYSAVNGKIDNPVEDNHSDNELIFQAYHVLLYSLQRLNPDDALTAPIYQEVAEMVDALLPSLHRSWTIVQGELSPLWLGIYAGTGGQHVSEKAVSDATWTLRRWSIDLITWPINNQNRWDVTLSPFSVRDSADSLLLRQILPQSERVTEKWNGDPFRLDASGSGMSEEAPYIFQLPYYLMLYNGLISKV